MTTFHTVASTVSGQHIDVSVTCEEGENVEACFRRFRAAVAVVESTP